MNLWTKTEQHNGDLDENKNTDTTTLQKLLLVSQLKKKKKSPLASILTFNKSNILSYFYYSD